MPAYAVAHLTEVRFGPEIVEYLERIDATLLPYGGAFLIHGGDKHLLEGEWPGALVVIEFPDRERALAWYASPAYQAILPLRTRNADGAAIIIDGVPPGYSAVTKARQHAGRMPDDEHTKRQAVKKENDS